jgi:hypothetical protein
MPRFGAQAYFVSLPSAWLGVIPAEQQGGSMSTLIETEGMHERDGISSGGSGSTEYDAVLTFSANFDCRIQGCAPNTKSAGYGADLLPTRSIAGKSRSQKKGVQGGSPIGKCLEKSSQFIIVPARDCTLTARA